MNGERLKQLRKERNLTQRQLAKKISVTNVSISGYESGNRSPDIDTLQKLADSFNVSTDYLLGRTDKQAPPPSEQDEEDLQAFANSPELQEFYKELLLSNEDAVKLLRDIWEIIKHEKK